jgi:hypothetical protein
MIRYRPCLLFHVRGFTPESAVNLEVGLFYGLGADC